MSPIAVEFVSTSTLEADTSTVSATVPGLKQQIDAAGTVDDYLYVLSFSNFEAFFLHFDLVSARRQTADVKMSIVV